MCGIAGKFYLDPSAHVDPLLLRQMAWAIQHRGPDDEGVFVDGPVGLASRRLAIIDLSSHGHQPISNEDGNIWIVFNGEIYNFQELREDLIAKGHRFQSHTDTEVIVHLYEDRGVECLQHLRGMFALAIWDSRDRTLFIARDRLGKKPLFYYFDGKVLIFASEPKAILVDPEASVEPDLEAINQYLTYLYVPSPLSAFRGFRKLPPAHYLTLRNGSLRVERYWKLRYGPKLSYPEAELCERLRHHLREAVRLRMISDVPLGAFLSGGLDSSAIVAYMSELSSGRVKTFSIGFEEDKYNELPFARRVAQLFGTDHHEFVVKPNAVEILPDLVWKYNEPFADSSAVPTYYLSKLARQHVTVALNGDAGDENFAGYFSRYRAILRYQMVDRLPAWLRKGLVFTSNLLPDSNRHLLKRWKRFIGHEGPYQKFARGISTFTDDMRIDLLSEEFRTQVEGNDPLGSILEVFATSDVQNLLDAALDVDVTTYLPDDLLVKVDIASMAHSLEARSPLVDHIFMEFAAGIPADMKLRRGTGKYIFKKAMAGILPPEVIHREKMGFGIPLEHWCRYELRELISETLLSPQAIGRGYFRPPAVRRLIDEHVSGVAKWHHHLWALLMLELWHRAFIDKRAFSPSQLPREVVHSTGGGRVGA